MGQFSRDSYFTDKRPLVDNIMYDRAPGKRERVDQGIMDPEHLGLHRIVSNRVSYSQLGTRRSYLLDQ